MNQINELIKYSALFSLEIMVGKSKEIETNRSLDLSKREYETVKSHLDVVAKVRYTIN